MKIHTAMRIIRVSLIFFLLFFAFSSLQKMQSAENDGAQSSETAEPAASPESARPSSKSNDSIIGLILAGGIVGHVIILLSVIAVALMIEHVLTIREKILIPPGFADEVARKLQEGRWSEAAVQCRENQSVLAAVLTAGMSEWDLGWNSVQRGVEDAISEQAARLYRKTEYLNLIGNIAPMLGLLGTVIGMVMAFRDLAADTEGFQRAGDLAQGIYLALITTVEGLIVAIPALGAYAIFNNRIALLIAETTYVAEQVLRPVKRKLHAATRTAPLKKTEPRQ